MKTLNRPMFRYGGPIKEGVMHGIREPKRNGGSMMSNNQGPRRAALVGNPIYPQGSDGRTRHVVPALLGAGSLIGRFVAPAFGRYVMRQAPKLAKDGSKMFYKTGKKKGEQIFSSLKSKTNPAVQGFDPNAVGRFFANDPLAGKAVSGAGFTGKALQKVGGGIKYATTTPSGLLFLGAPVTYSAGKYFLNSGEEIKGKDLEKITKDGVNTPSGNNPFGYEDDVKAQSDKRELTPAEREALENKTRNEQMEGFREIMDIKGMNKDAAYKSLIDASKIIQEGGNLKKQLKDGSLIQKVTAAASKRFDKVSDTENALRSLVAKGEIDKLMNKDKNALDNAVKNAQLKAYNKQNEGLTTSEVIQKRLQTAKGEFPQGDELRKLISLRNPELNAKTLPSGDIPTNVDALDYITGQVAAINADETTPDYPDGVYVIKDRIIQVLEGQVIPISVNQLA